MTRTDRILAACCGASIFIMPILGVVLTGK